MKTATEQAKPGVDAPYDTILIAKVMMTIACSHLVVVAKMDGSGNPSPAKPHDEDRAATMATAAFKAASAADPEFMRWINQDVADSN